MAYNNYYPVSYVSPWNQAPAPYFQQIQQSNAAQQTRPTMQSGFVVVQSEQEARSYPVAPGNSITFKDESGPYCYVKTMGFNQLDRPTFERYRLVKEETPQEAENGPTSADNKKDIEAPYALKSDIAALWEAVDELKAKADKKRKKEVIDDDE